MKKTILMAMAMVLVVAMNGMAQQYQGSGETYPTKDQLVVKTIVGTTAVKAPSGGLYVGGTALTATADQINQAGSKAANAVTNATVQTASVAGSVTLQGPNIDVILSDGSTNTIQKITNVVVTVAGVTTNISLSR